MPAHLNRKQQREIKAVVERAKKDNGIPQTAQQSIPFQRMFPDGICRVTDNYYTKTIQYQDINYQLAQQEDKTAIFDEWCSFLNFFDSSIHFELSFMNMGTDAESFEKSVRIPFQKDEFNPVRAEYSQMLKKQLSQGNNGLTKTKYLTFGIEAESMRQAKPRLAHIENDLLNNFRRLGVVATPMDGKERLRLMHAMFHMGDDDKFFFDWKWLVESGLSVKDFIAPTAFAFKNNRTFQMGSLYGSMSFLSISASDLSDRMLADFLDMESSQIVTIHIQSVDQTAAIKTIKRTITELDRSKIEEQKKAVRSGYDMDIIPSDLATYGRDAKALLKELQSQNERMFMVTFLVMNRILNVTLTNYGLGNVIASSRLTAEQWERYKVLLETLGNRSYLFGEDVSSAPGGGGEYTDYDIPGEALTDTAFANMVREAEKYLGYPYVWGGSSPSTSFDCSGFVSWVINNCGNGWSVGRQTANGLKNLCDIIPPSEAKPGDLIFFQGTYNTSGASHVGIYVGNGMMIHCGDPISYASIETNYWQQHFYCFGRIP